MSEVRTVTFTTEEISEILRVAATGDQVWVCDKSVQLHRERNDSCCLLFHTAVAALPSRRHERVQSKPQRCAGW